MDIEANTLLVAGFIENPNMLVPWYLITSYAYYVLDESVVTDEMYDQICSFLAMEVSAESITHPHLHFCDPEALTAGTGYQITEYPAIAISVANGFIRGVYPCVS